LRAVFPLACVKDLQGKYFSYLNFKGKINMWRIWVTDLQLQRQWVGNQPGIARAGLIGCCTWLPKQWGTGTGCFFLSEMGTVTLVFPADSGDHKTQVRHPGKKLGTVRKIK
jgi:hypothetical protein